MVKVAQILKIAEHYADDDANNDFAKDANCTNIYGEQEHYATFVTHAARMKPGMNRRTVLTASAKPEEASQSKGAPRLMSWRCPVYRMESAVAWAPDSESRHKSKSNLCLKLHSCVKGPRLQQNYCSLCKRQ